MNIRIEVIIKLNQQSVALIFEKGDFWLPLYSMPRKKFFFNALYNGIFPIQLIHNFLKYFHLILRLNFFIFLECEVFSFDVL